MLAPTTRSQHTRARNACTSFPRPVAHCWCSVTPILTAIPSHCPVQCPRKQKTHGRFAAKAPQNTLGKKQDAERDTHSPRDSTETLHRTTVLQHCCTSDRDRAAKPISRYVSDVYLLTPTPQDDHVTTTATPVSSPRTTPRRVTAALSTHPRPYNTGRPPSATFLTRCVFLPTKPDSDTKTRTPHSSKPALDRTVCTVAPI